VLILLFACAPAFARFVPPSVSQARDETHRELGLAGASSLSLESCVACSIVGRAVNLCEPHEAEELAALERESTRLKSKDAATRMAALDALAALVASHTNAPSARVAKRIASSLDDDDIEVRSHCTSLLGRPQHALVSLDALMDALARSTREHGPLNAEYDALSDKLRGKLSDKRRADLQADREACNERRRALARWRRELVDRLATFPDDRAVNAILAHTHRNLLTGGDGALVRLGNRTAVRALAESIAGCERNRALVQKEVDDWKARAIPGTTLGMALAQKALEELQAADFRARQELITLFAERGLTAPGTSANSAVWRAWIEENIRAFPEHLPGLSSPAW
jgi:hypothetical protein